MKIKKFPRYVQLLLTGFLCLVPPACPGVSLRKGGEYQVHWDKDASQNVPLSIFIKCLISNTFIKVNLHNTKCIYCKN